jgi:hypothetical protein
MRDICAAIGIVLVACLGFAWLCVGAAMIIDHTTCELKQAGQTVYVGPSYNVNCKSMGASTQCTIGSGGWLCWMPSRHLLGNDLTVECK